MPDKRTPMAEKTKATVPVTKLKILNHKIDKLVKPSQYD